MRAQASDEERTLAAQRTVLGVHLTGHQESAAVIGMVGWAHRMQGHEDSSCASSLCDEIIQHYEGHHRNPAKRFVPENAFLTVLWQNSVCNSYTR